MTLTDTGEEQDLGESFVGCHLPLSPLALRRGGPTTPPLHVIQSNKQQSIPIFSAACEKISIFLLHSLQHTIQVI